MARHKVTHSTNSTMIVIKGDRRNPEPETAIIKFPGGSVEVTRTSDDQYWTHVAIDIPGQGLRMPDDPTGIITESRIDYDLEGYRARHQGNMPVIPPIPMAEHIQHMAIKVAVEPKETDHEQETAASRFRQRGQRAVGARPAGAG